MARSEAEYTAGLVETCKRELLEEFEEWYRANHGSGAAAEEVCGGTVGVVIEGKAWQTCCSAVNLVPQPQ